MSEGDAKRIVYSNRNRGFGLLWIAIFWTAVGCPLAYYIISNQQSALRWLAIAIPLFGILGIVSGVRVAILGMRYPELTLVLDKVPLRPGERFTARVEAADLPDGKIEATLKCVQNPKREDTKEVWSDSHVIPRSYVRGTPPAIPIDFKLPFDALETSAADEIVWELSVTIGERAEVEGRFEVPVIDHRN